MISNIFVYRMYKREKMAIFSFHIAPLLLIMLGAGVIRQFSFEGIMVIKEGETSDFIYTADPHLLVKVQNKKTGKSKVIEKKHYLSEVTHGFGNYFSDELTGKSDITVEYVNFQSKRVDSFQINKKFKIPVVLDIVTEGMKSNYIDENSTVLVGNIPLGFDNTIKSNGIKPRKQNETIEWSANFRFALLKCQR